jgi:hypothetical protein
MLEDSAMYEFSVPWAQCSLCLSYALVSGRQVWAGSITDVRMRVSIAA